MKRIAIVILPMMITITTLLADGPILSNETQTLLKEAKAQVPSIEAQKLKESITEGKVVLLDVRDPDEWEKSTIQYDRQVKISRGFLEIKYPKLILDKYSKDDTFVVYCALEPRSVFAAQRLQQLGFKHVMYLQGGLKSFNSLP